MMGTDEGWAKKELDKMDRELDKPIRSLMPRPTSDKPPMPEGFTDRAAWDAIHWVPSRNGSLIDQAVISWQRDNQDRVRAALAAAARAAK